MRGRIFNIQRYSLHDGAGIRTVVFFKGCPLHCPWCSNPESRSPDIQYVRHEQQCLHCQACTHDVETCPSGAYQQIGQDMTIDEIVAICKRDAVFYRTSSGGVTLSGGEVLAQAPFATALLQRLQQAGFRTAIETTGHGGQKPLLKMAASCNEILFDLKIINPEQAKAIAGIHSQQVLDNFRALSLGGYPVIPRIPLIPGYTMSEVNLNEILDFLAPLPVTEVHLLPFHQLGSNKYTLLNMDYALKDTPVPETDQIQLIKDRFSQVGYAVTIGG
ncbi:[formate-C-acetyltransferase]-activating enzyme [Celerinatantimonas sp. YJH-8]|uniref:[formate-C-acetyltransferase]-activating enzyme n=1 Tax=Celerinatantimonas sp. YJH-8 TaxID=3228714 RepID=UPI0038C99B3C